MLRKRIFESIRVLLYKLNVQSPNLRFKILLISFLEFENPFLTNRYSYIDNNVNISVTS